jgi:predicted enzyme related to lactoylglutathione lyase
MMDKVRAAEFFRELFDWHTHEQGLATMVDAGADSGVSGHITSLGHEPRHYVTVLR